MLKRSLAVLALALAAPLALTGCVERKITFGSSPSGALLTLNDEELGRTPITVPFQWYGDYNVVLRLEKNVGTADHPDIKRYYLHTHRRASAPWFQWFGVDLFTEILPYHWTDEKIWAFDVPEIVEPADADLIQRARALKAQVVVPPAAATTATRPATEPATESSATPETPPSP